MKLLGNEILATDLDNTLVGHPGKLEHLWSYFEVKNIDISLVYITGRHFDSAMELIEEHHLPKPNILICDVGATIYLGPDFLPDEQWQIMTSADWKPDIVLDIMERFKEVKRQPLPNDYRLSYIVKDKPDYVREIEEALREYHLAFHLIYSSNKDMDILPSHTNKGTALQYVLENYAPKDPKILVAGDSGNDLDMMRLGLPSVMVGNSQQELKQHSHLPNVYVANGSYALGIQEGWHYFY